MKTPFPEHPPANELHDHGLDLALRGRFAEAHEVLGEARRSVKDWIYSEREASRLSDDEDWIKIPGNQTGASLQLYGIERDDGFTFTCEALATGKAKLLETSFRKLTGTQLGLIPLLSSDATTHTPIEQNFIESTYGVVLDLQHRVSVINSYFFKGAVTVIAAPERFITEGDKFNAWEHLLHGSDHYFNASHAMNAARLEQLEEHGLAARMWVNRARQELALARLDDSDDNTLNARRVMEARYPTMHSAFVALASLKFQS